MISSERGSLYVEALVALGVLAFALIPIYSAFGLGPGALDQAARQTAALNLARARLESLQAEPWDSLVSRPAAPSESQPAYSVRQTVIYPDPVLPLKQITVVVAWTDSRGRPHDVTVATSIARRDP